jgi:Flp pilus assembly secretin CpaC
MLEVSLSKLRKCGLTNPLLKDSGFAFGSVETAGFLGLDKLVLKDWSPEKPYTKPADSTPDSMIRWLEENRFARVLARPSIIVTNGRTGSIFQGEEIPVQAGGDPTNIELHKCGTELDVLAVSQLEDKVRLHLRVRVSNRDESNAVIAASTSTPPMQVRQIDTAVETKYGDPVVLCGLKQIRTESIKTEKGIKDEQNELALLVIVTPERVDSIAAQPRETEAK